MAETHSPEPWDTYPGQHPRWVELVMTDYRRAAVCVNALAGVDDPALQVQQWQQMAKAHSEAPRVSVPRKDLQELSDAFTAVAMSLPNEEDLLNAASLNEGRATPWDRYCVRLRKAVAALRGAL
jgi:hypothetical protein